MKSAVIFTGLVIMVLTGCKETRRQGQALFDQENLVAWCIVPFDAENRSPRDRALMLRELGIPALAYDYRDAHIPSFPEEMAVLREQGIRLHAVWLWADPGQEDVMGTAGRTIFNMLERSRTRTEIWVGMPDNAFEGLSREESMQKALKALQPVLEETEKIGCTLALYNHGGWFGEPDNLVALVEALGPDRVKIVYNFHHAHDQVEGFRESLPLMLPYLSTININGMRVEGPKILPLGEGDREAEMLRIIASSGYSGPIGILGHTVGEDIRMVLERNLQGLEKLKREL